MNFSASPISVNGGMAPVPQIVAEVAMRGELARLSTKGILAVRIT